CRMSMCGSSMRSVRPYSRTAPNRRHRPGAARMEAGESDSMKRKRPASRQRYSEDAHAREGMREAAWTTRPGKSRASPRRSDGHLLQARAPGVVSGNRRGKLEARGEILRLL